MKELIEILVGYSKPGTLYEGVAPLGETGLSRRVRAILYLEAAYRSLVRRQCWRIGTKHLFPMFLTNTGTMRESWQAEVMRIMDNPRFGSRENLTVQLFHEKFQAEPSIPLAQKDEERRLFDALMDRYRSDGYVMFRNRLGFHIDLQEAMKPPTSGGCMHEMTGLILAWYRFVATIVYQREPSFFTEFAVKDGREMAAQYKRVMLDTLAHRRRNERTARRKSSPSDLG